MPAFEHLVEVCIKNGRAQSQRSWERYGRDLFDFFSFVDTNRYDWSCMPLKGMPGVLEIYRDWSLKECGLSHRTVNQRLRTIQRFYVWAWEKELVKALPWSDISVRVNRPAGFLAHTSAKGNVYRSTSLVLRQPKKLVKLLTLDQCVACLRATNNIGHRLLFRLALQTGLRSEELQTFPEKYLFDPANRQDLKSKFKVRIDLDPADMKLKGNHGRSIDVPIELMADLWQYSVLQRPRLARAATAPTSTLFLTEWGNRHNRSSIQNLFHTIATKVGFHLTCHMLRHTYATYTLHGLRESEFAGEPLMYVRDRLGHSSIHTTEIYLHLLNQLDADLMLKHDEEINALFREAAQT
ncbi:MAG TPA: site-specific integrase [Methylobacter sp.]